MSFSATIRVRCLQPANLKRITFSVLFTKPLQASPSISFYYKTVQYGNYYSHLPFTFNYGVPVAIYGSPVTSNNCFFGFQYYAITLHSGDITTHLQISGLEITDIYYSTDIYAALLTGACLAQCLPSYFMKTLNSSCVKCSDFMQNCFNCLS